MFNKKKCIYCCKRFLRPSEANSCLHKLKDLGIGTGLQR